MRVRITVGESRERLGAGRVVFVQVEGEDVEDGVADLGIPGLGNAVLLCWVENRFLDG